MTKAHAPTPHAMARLVAIGRAVLLGGKAAFISTPDLRSLSSLLCVAQKQDASHTNRVPFATLFQKAL